MHAFAERETVHMVANAFAGGWFHSGDLGVMHPEGYVELLDRARDFVMIGVPSKRWGERPKAFVLLCEGASADEQELIDHVRSRIAHFKVPDMIEFLPELPRASTGKVQKS